MLQFNPIENNYAFIDSQNLHLTIKKQGWILDFKKFRRYLQDKYKVEKAFIFIGFVPQNQALYTGLQKDGYILVFKPTLPLPAGKVKGNVDAELVLHAMISYLLIFASINLCYMPIHCLKIMPHLPKNHLLI